MNDEREFKIKITTAADTSGAKETSAALNETAEATRKSGEEHKKAGDEAGKHGAHLRGLHKIFHALNEVVPGLGVAMQAAFSPIGAAISLALIALRAFHEKMKEVNDEFKRMEEEAAKPLDRRLESLRDATVQAATGMAGLRAKLDEAARGERNLKDAFGEAIETMREQMRESGSISEALKENELANLEAIHKAGLLSEEEYSQEKLGIEMEYLRKKHELEEREQMTEILMKRRQVEDAEGNQGDLTKAAELAELKRVKALEDLHSLTPRAEIDENKKKTAGELRAFEEKHGQWSQWFEGFGANAKPSDVSSQLSTRENLSAFQASGGFRGMFGGAGLSEAYTEWARLKVASDAANAAWQHAPADEAKRTVAAEAAGREAARAEERAAQNQSFVTEGNRDITLRRGRLSSRHQENREVEGIEADTLGARADARAVGSPEGKLLRDVSEAEAILQHGGQISTKQSAEIKTAAAMLSSSHISQGEMILKGLGSAHGSIETLSSQIASVVKALEKQHKQMKNQGSPP